MLQALRSRCTHVLHLGQHYHLPTQMKQADINFPIKTNDIKDEWAKSSKACGFYHFKVSFILISATSRYIHQAKMLSLRVRLNCWRNIPVWWMMGMGSSMFLSTDGENQLPGDFLFLNTVWRKFSGWAEARLFRKREAGTCFHWEQDQLIRADKLQWHMGTEFVIISQPVTPWLRCSF